MTVKCHISNKAPKRAERMGVLIVRSISCLLSFLRHVFQKHLFVINFNKTTQSLKFIDLAIAFYSDCFSCHNKYYVQKIFKDNCAI